MEFGYREFNNDIQDKKSLKRMEIGHVIVY